MIINHCQKNIAKITNPTFSPNVSIFEREFYTIVRVYIIDATSKPATSELKQIKYDLKP